MPILAPGFLGGSSAGNGGGPVSSVQQPEYFYVIPVAGQSNAMAYGEGLPLPDTLDAPHPRIKQLARRATVTPGGDACKYNDIIPLDHCPHDVQDMSGINHPRADLSKGQYGCVSQTLHIARKLLAWIPDNAGILMVPCCRGGSAFTQGVDGTFNVASGASETATRWGAGKPLYRDLLTRTKAALDSNPKNMLLAVCWMQGEFDMTGAAYAQQPALFDAMVRQFRTDLADYAGQCPDFRPDSVPWLCGDTTYYWKRNYPAQYDAVYGAYSKTSVSGVHCVPFMVSEDGTNTPTNAPAEDPNVPAAGYFGSASRTSANWTSSIRNSHFSSWARRNIIAERMAAAILLHAGRRSLLAAPVSGSAASSTGDTGNVGTSTLKYAPVVEDAGYNGRRGDGTPEAQGWSASGGNFNVAPHPDGKGGHVLQIRRKASEVWKMERATRQAADLLRYGGEVQCNFRLVNTLTANQFAFGCYLLVNESDVPAGAPLRLKAEGTTPALMNFFIQTNATDLNLMMHCKPDNIRLGTYGAYNQDWHSFRVVYHGGNTARATLYLDGESKGEFTLAYSPGAVDAGMLQLTNITSSPTYGCNIKDFTVKIYRDDAIVSLPDDDVSSLVYFPEGSRGGKVVLPDAKISAGNTVQVVVNNAGIIAIEPASSNVLLNNLPSSATTDRSVTLVQTSLDGKTWVIT
ncbi:sialate O-acetylesterase [Escherichia coli]|nr:sialate O-acetylesterase [Escherichia coli]